MIGAASTYAYFSAFYALGFTPSIVLNQPNYAFANTPSIYSDFNGSLPNLGNSYLSTISSEAELSSSADIWNAESNYDMRYLFVIKKASNQWVPVFKDWQGSDFG